jgi:hypothetical protein
MSDTPRCEMRDDCESPVTHIGSKGYIYCTEHAVLRHDLSYERTRKMTFKELRTIREGHPLEAY